MARPRTHELGGPIALRADVEARPARVSSLVLKHALDRVIAAGLLLLLLPLLLAVALVVLVCMGRPVLFTQRRAGLHGRPFTMLKFRSMVRDAERQGEGLPGDKLEDDPRVTPVGRILRKTSLDELPQLVNVVLGSMSLVGPRPLPLAEQRRLRNWRTRRLSMRPGMTGLWQVSGRNDLGFEAWMLLDLRYVDDWSPLLDLKILLRTIPVVISGRGAR